MVATSATQIRQAEFAIFSFVIVRSTGAAVRVCSWPTRPGAAALKKGLVKTGSATKANEETEL